MNGAQAFVRGLRLLKAVSQAEPRGLRLSEAADVVGISRPTARRLLVALVEEGFVEQGRAGGLYMLRQDAIALPWLGSDAIDWEEIAHDSARRMACLTQDVALFAIRSGRRTVILAREEGAFPVRTHVASVGDRHPAGVGAAWVSMMSRLPDEQVDVLLADNSRRLEEFPNFTDEKVRALVAEARMTGYALNPGLIFTGAWAMGVPIVDPRGRPVAAVTIAAVEARLATERRREIKALLDEESRLVTQSIGNIWSTRSSGAHGHSSMDSASAGSTG